MKKPSPALIIAFVALFASVSGASYATSQLPNAPQLAKKSVGTKQIKKQAVTSQKIAKQAVGKGKIKPKAVKSGKIADEAVSAKKLADSAVTSSKIADGAVTGSKIEAGSINAAALAPGVLPTYSTNVVYASVEADGTLLADRSAGLTQQNFERSADGVFCIVASPVSASVQATLNGAAPGWVTVELDPSAIPSGCSDTTSAVVRTYSDSAALEDRPFSVQLTG